MSRRYNSASQYSRTIATRFVPSGELRGYGMVGEGHCDVTYKCPIQSGEHCTEVDMRGCAIARELHDLTSLCKQDATD